MSKIGKAEWMFLYVVMGIVDFVQFAIDFTGIGAVINIVADPFIGVLLGLYFQIRGVSMIKHPSRLLSLFGVAVLEGATAGIAPAWIVDVWYIHHTVKKENAKIANTQKQNDFLRSNIRKPLYEGGIRRPETDKDDLEMPANMDGIRAPNGGLRQ